LKNLVNFLISFLVYLAAFALGSALTWLAVKGAVTANDADQALSELRSTNSTKAAE
jgi:hypothetical protein